MFSINLSGINIKTTIDNKISYIFSIGSIALFVYTVSTAFARMRPTDAPLLPNL